MSDNEIKQLDKSEVTRSNIWTAIVLGIIALIVGIMPFFYIKDIG